LSHAGDGTKCRPHWFHTGKLPWWNRRRTREHPIGVRAGRRIVIEDVYPSVDNGRFAVKRVVGEPFDVWADIVRDGNAVLAAELLWRPEMTGKWSRTTMRPHGDDRWTAAFTPSMPGRYEYAIEAWTDVFGTWRRDILSKREAGLDVSLETPEGWRILAGLKPRNVANTRLIDELSRKADTTGTLDELLSESLAAMAATDQQTDLTRSATFPLLVDRPLARARAWY
jgi:starch synthase (maltosyl-transferring)